MNKNIIIGFGGHSKVIIDILKRNQQDIYGIIDNSKLVNTNSKIRYKFIGNISHLLKLKNKKEYNIYIAIGDSKIRRKVFGQLKHLDFNFPTLICPTAILSDDCKIGKGSFINSGCILNTKVSIGMFSIINTGSIIDHESKVGNFSQICPGVKISGQVKIGNDSFIGTGTTINNCLTLSSNLIIGSGSVITSSLLNTGTAVGIPCRYIKK